MIGIMIMIIINLRGVLLSALINCNIDHCHGDCRLHHHLHHHYYNEKRHEKALCYGVIILVRAALGHQLIKIRFSLLNVSCQALCQSLWSRLRHPPSWLCAVLVGLVVSFFLSLFLLY